MVAWRYGLFSSRVEKNISTLEEKFVSSRRHVISSISSFKGTKFTLCPFVRTKSSIWESGSENFFMLYHKWEQHWGSVRSPLFSKQCDWLLRYDIIGSRRKSLRTSSESIGSDDITKHKGRTYE